MRGYLTRTRSHSLRLGHCVELALWCKQLTLLLYLLYSYRGLSTEGARASVAPRAARTAAAAAASRGHTSTANYQHRGLPQPLGETAPTAARTSADREVEEFEE